MSEKSFFKVGDRVEVIEDNITGLVIAVKNDLITVETEDGFELQFQSNEIVPLMDQKMVNFGGAAQKQRDFHQELKSKQKRKQQERRPKAILPMEVDLHIEKLVKDHRRLPVHEILEIQLDRAKRSIDLAIQKKIPKLVLIHGVGQGVLKAELNFLIGRYEGLRQEPADYQNYGQGATLIHVSQKASRW